jgi:hypothetical protein
LLVFEISNAKEGSMEPYNIYYNKNIPENLFPSENAVSAVMQSEDEKVLIKPHSLRRKEILNGFK